MFVHVWAWEKGIQREREEGGGVEKNGNGGGAGCQVCGPLALESTNSRWGWRRGWGRCQYPGWPPELEWLSGVGYDPGGLDPWKEIRERKRKEKETEAG